MRYMSDEPKSSSLINFILRNSMFLQKIFFMLLISGVCLAQTHPYRDLQHDSKVFGRSKTYRVYLPEGYSQSAKHYPVIYFFHGWGGCYYKDDSANLEYDLLGDLVDKYQVIMVLWDGNMEESEPRPYNTGNHEDVKYQVQVKDYFPELVGHIDSSYRTLTDRDHRGIIGFSMGGFMSAFIAGKYPEMVSAIVNMVGSPEFFVGYPDNHVLYPIRYTFENLKDVSVRLHNMDNCPLTFMNTEVKNAAAWEGQEHFEYWMGEGDHKVDDPGETKVFESAMQFIINRFNNPVAPQKSWSHYDLYADFDVWGYAVKSDKREPGFLYLRNVTKAGFGFYTRKWLPDGPVLTHCTSSVTTAPIYKKGDTYDILLYHQGSENPVLHSQKADQAGRLHFELDGIGCEVSITHKSQPADFVVLNHHFDQGKRFIRVNESNKLIITLLNRGGNTYRGKKIQLTVHCDDPSVSLSNAIQELTPDKNGRTCQSQPIGLSTTKTPPGDASPPWIKLHVQIRCAEDVFADALTVPVFYDAPYFKHIRIDDGRSVWEKPLGKGNRNGIAEASEQIMIYENYQRLRLYTDDPYVESISEVLYDQALPGTIWPDGFTLSSIVKIADNCPSGHTIEFLANYETKTFMPIRREVHWGKVRIKVK